MVELPPTFLHLFPTTGWWTWTRPVGIALAPQLTQHAPKQQRPTDMEKAAEHFCHESTDVFLIGGTRNIEDLSAMLFGYATG